MRKRTWVCAALLVGVACNKKVEQKQAEPTPKTVEQKKPEPTAAMADVPVTSKSPEAVKHFEQGRDLVDNQRGGEAAEHFKKAIELDPDFAQAHLYLGIVTPGPAGVEAMTKAGTFAATLPEAEQKLIEGLLATRDNDRAKATAAFEKVLATAPGAWRVDVMLANQATAAGDSEGAIKRLEHALQAKPDLAIAYNGIAYARAGQREWDQAITAAKKQVELLPKQPNPQDTLGEIMLVASKFDEAEKAFEAAQKLEPKFTLAWQGIALARAYRGDFKGAGAALDSWKQASATLPGAKYTPYFDGAWLAIAENKLPQALASLDTIEKDAEAKPLPIYAFAALDRAHILQMAGKYADATKWYATAATRTDGLPAAAKANAIRGHHLGVLRTAAMTGKPAADAEKLVAGIEEQAKSDPGNKTLQSDLTYARGLAAWAKKDVKGAIAELSKCEPIEFVCRFDLAAAQRKSGDKAGAEATEKQLRETPQRAAPAVYVATHLPKA